jgi:hypothetical protein
MAARQMCWRPPLINVISEMIGVPYEALTGEYGLAWQLVSWGITAPVILTGLWAWLVLLGRMFGRGLAGGPLPDPASPPSPEEVIARNGAHGAAENGREAPDGSDVGPDYLGTLPTWIPHPDDPPPAEASRTPGEEEEPAPVLTQADSQPVSTEAQARPRRSKRRRRLRG